MTSLPKFIAIDGRNQIFIMYELNLESVKLCDKNTDQKKSPIGTTKF